MRSWMIISPKALPIGQKMLGGMPTTSVGDNSPIAEGIQMSNKTRRESAMEKGTARLI